MKNIGVVAGMFVLLPVVGLGCGTPAQTSAPVPPPALSSTTPIAVVGSAGETLFKTRLCVTCHNFGLGDQPTGPDLKGVFSRRSKDWVRRWLSKPSAMMQSDPDIQALVKKFNGVMMPDPFPALTEQEIDQLIRYIETQ